MDTQKLFLDLWSKYISLNPDATKIHSLFQERGETVVNDHVAFRTLNHESIGVEAHANYFAQYGYKACDEYVFKEKKLKALHLENTDATLPKIFISELLCEQFSPFLQEKMNEVTSYCSKKNFDSIFNQGCFWKIQFDTFTRLNTESEYAAWLYNHGFCANHFTVFVNPLSTFQTIPDINQFLRDNHFELNTSGGEVKGSPESYLEQSSTMSSKVELQFTDGTYEVPGCYYEFARRYEDKSGQLFQGFVTQSADKIFESTNTK